MAEHGRLSEHDSVESGSITEQVQIKDRDLNL